jgi:manganese/iron transport system ATP-binding protein
MLEVQHLSVFYRGIEAIADVSFSLPQGCTTGLIGPNGAGKSTLLKAMLNLVPIANGRVLYAGNSLKSKRQNVAYVPQRSQIDWDYPITVKNVVMMAETARLGWFHAPTLHSDQLVQAALERTEIWHLRDRPINQLSGGQQQRVFLAKAIAQQAEILLLDEPLSGIDKKTEAIIFEIYSELKQAGKILIISCHEWGETLNKYDHLLLLNRNLIAQGEPETVMTLENVRQAYGMFNQSSGVPKESLLFC